MHVKFCDWVNRPDWSGVPLHKDICIIDCLDMRNGEELGFKLRKPTFKYRPEKQLSSLRIFAISLSSSKFLDIIPNARTASFHILSYSFYHKTVQVRVWANIVKRQQKIEKRKKKWRTMKISEAGHNFFHSSHLKIVWRLTKFCCLNWLYYELSLAMWRLGLTEGSKT